MFLLPPITGDKDLDAYNLEVYNLLMGQEAPVIYNKGTGIIRDTSNQDVVGYLYRYLHVKFANDTIGTSFSNTATGRSFYGLHNSDDPSESLEYYDYEWTEVETPFSGSSKLFYRVLGGRLIDLFIGSAPPDARWVEMTGDSVDLDDLVLPGTIITDMLADGAVTEPKLASDAVSTIKIQDGAVDTFKLADGSVTEPKLDTTGTPSSTTFLNGNMEWVASPTASFNPRKSILTNTQLLAGDSGYYLWHAPTAGSAIVGIPDDSTEGYYFLAINLDASSLIIRSEENLILRIGDGLTSPAWELPQFGYAEVILLAGGNWVIKSDEALAILDPSVDLLLLESGDALVTEDSKFVLIEYTVLLTEAGDMITTESDSDLTLE